MFVGVGAARVRDLFEQARKAAPAIVFIDEIDAIGQSRGGGGRIGGNDEREQTLNQLLAEIDGFKTSADKPVIIMAATNRPEVLDPALLRAGRFDRQVAVGNPDLIGRQQILRIHSRSITLAPDFDIERAARMTPGFSGADLANVMNEAALLAARREAEAVTIADFEAAIERVVAGLEQRTRVMNERSARRWPTTSAATPWSPSWCRTPIPSARSASSRAAAARSATPCRCPPRIATCSPSKSSRTASR